jgi:hypothetical protein
MPASANLGHTDEPFHPGLIDCVWDRWKDMDDEVRMKEAYLLFIAARWMGARSSNREEK